MGTRSPYASLPAVNAHRRRQASGPGTIGCGTCCYRSGPRSKVHMKRPAIEAETGAPATCPRPQAHRRRRTILERRGKRAAPVRRRELESVEARGPRVGVRARRDRHAHVRATANPDTPAGTQWSTAGARTLRFLPHREPEFSCWTMVWLRATRLSTLCICAAAVRSRIGCFLPHPKAPTDGTICTLLPTWHRSHPREPSTLRSATRVERISARLASWACYVQPPAD
jgi:hypothetical protein